MIATHIGGMSELEIQVSLIMLGGVYSTQFVYISVTL